jgi:hypothetical protein
MEPDTPETPLPPKPSPEADDVLVIPPKPGEGETPDQVGFVPLMAQLFLIPLVIVAICVGVFMLFGWMAADQRSGMELLGRIEDYAGADNKMTPWMNASKNEAAFQLMMLIRGGDKKLYEGARGHARSGGGVTDREAFENALIAAFGRLQKRDPDTAGLLAQAIGYIGSPAGRAALKEALPSSPPQLRFECARALAVLRDGESFSAFVELLTDNDAGCRMLAAWAIRFLADPSAAATQTADAGRRLNAGQVREAIEKIRPLLKDGTEDVRYNAAGALAALGSDEGVPALLELLDKGHVSRLTERAKTEADHPLRRRGETARNVAVLNMASALQALGHLGGDNGIADAALRKKVGERIKDMAADGTLDPVVQQEAGKLIGKFGS